ncbi:MAG: hypothetical protein HC902_03185 [Calothrix sp. SM1_5_4]|nr:hypothetical protein [Calothrix sp. SM1_5_4]
MSPKVLLDDLREARRSSVDLPPKVLRSKKRTWVRFHRKVDETGLFLSFVRQLFGFGLSIQLSSVHTLPGIGVYDWFCLRTEKSPRQIAKWLALPVSAPSKIPQVAFQSIDLMAQDKDEWVISFRGKDQRGLLLNAAQSLVEENLGLRWRAPIPGANRLMTSSASGLRARCNRFLTD